MTSEIRGLISLIFIVNFISKNSLFRIHDQIVAL